MKNHQDYGQILCLYNSDGELLYSSSEDIRNQEEKEKKQRSSVLLAMTARHSKEYREYYIGKEQEVLFEQCHEIEGRQYLTGHTRNYVRVAVPVEGIDPAEMTNQERICCLTGFADDETLLGTY